MLTQVDCVLEPPEKNIHGGAFLPQQLDLETEKQARRINDPLKARTWKVSNPAHQHPITGKHAPHGFGQPVPRIAPHFPTGMDATTA